MGRRRLQVALFTIFLLVVKRDSRKTAHADRKKIWKASRVGQHRPPTTPSPHAPSSPPLPRHCRQASDYAVMITGLEVGAAADDHDGEPGLESRLYDDLASIGFKRDEIDHIEV